MMVPMGDKEIEEASQSRISEGIEIHVYKDEVKLNQREIAVTNA
jgi:hypothetical protein